MVFRGRRSLPCFCWVRRKHPDFSSDEVADRTARKKSYAVRCGFERASRHAMELTVLAGLASPWVLSEYGPLWAIGLALPSFATLLAARSARAKRKVLPFVFSGASALNLLYATWIAASFFQEVDSGETASSRSRKSRSKRLSSKTRL